jgi:D-tyrosyl-tRNA(Tyr) deacylase
VRAVVQRVRGARIRVEGETVAEMGAGLLALVGVGRADGEEAARELAQKLVHLRILEDEAGKMNRSLLDVGGTLGLVSQFTLFGDVRKGRRPAFVEAAPAEQAEPLVDAVASAARELGVPVVTGCFGAMMDVALVNAGPVTLLLDTERRF